jgi:hypothetical protein
MAMPNPSTEPRSRQNIIGGHEFRPLHGALKDSELVAQRENLELERSTAAKRGAIEAISAVNKCPNGNRIISDNSQSINMIGIFGNHRLLPQNTNPQ